MFIIQNIKMNGLFNYPLDNNYILRKKKFIKREILKKTEKKFIEKKIAILGGSTTAEIKDVLELFLLNEGIQPIFYESEYNKYYEDALFEEKLIEFKPEIVYIHTSYRNIKEFPEINENIEEIEKKINDVYSKFFEIWENLRIKFNCEIIQNNFEYPQNRIMGNYDRVSSYGKINFIDKINLKFVKYAQNNKKFYINDINYISAQIGLDNWEDSLLWFGYKYAISYDAIPILCKNISNIIKSIFGKNKKCIVLDLDNTLWGGVIGDDGINGIRIGTETAIGEAYNEFQNHIKEIKKMGITLAISSKNEENIAKEGLNLKDMVLKEEDFYSIKANWDPKPVNIVRISNEINIGLDSLVFLDDNPVEREIVKKNLCEVAVPDIGEEVTKYVNYLTRNGYFEITSLSKEDLERNKYYEENKKRAEEKNSFKNYTEFLLSLKMKAEIDFSKPEYYERITQLINKTNQFNLTTKRYSLPEIEEISKNKNKLIYYGRLKDKFGDNGLISAVIANVEDNELHIDLWLMSCRVLKRGMEKAMFDFLIKYCKNKNITKIYGYYYKTSKNNMVKDFYKELGFENIVLEKEKSIWKIDVKNVNEQNKIIKVGEY